MYPILKPLLLPALLILLGACSTPSLDVQVGGEFAAEGLYPVKSSGFAEAFARPEAGLAGYRVVEIPPLGVGNIDVPKVAVAGTNRRDWLMTPEREAALQATWAGAMNRAFSDYRQSGSGPGVLRISAELTRIAPGRPTATTIGGSLQPAGSTQDVVEMWAEFRLYDAASGQLLAVIRDNRTFTSVAMSRTAPIAVDSLFKSWAALLHTRVSGA